MKKSAFPSRITLGTGYPWANGIGPYYEVTMRVEPVGSVNKSLRFPKALWSQHVPKYRLVLERVDGVTEVKCNQDKKPCPKCGRVYAPGPMVNHRTKCGGK